MADKAWKAEERTVARMFGTSRQLMKGAGAFWIHVLTMVLMVFVLRCRSGFHPRPRIRPPYYFPSLLILFHFFSLLWSFLMMIIIPHVIRPPATPTTRAVSITLIPPHYTLDRMAEHVYNLVACKKTGHTEKIVCASLQGFIANIKCLKAILVLQHQGRFFYVPDIIHPKHVQHKPEFHHLC